jgi:hypothetical protein
MCQLVPLRDAAPVNDTVNEAFDKALGVLPVKIPAKVGRVVTPLPGVRLVTHSRVSDWYTLPGVRLVTRSRVSDWLHGGPMNEKISKHTRCHQSNRVLTAAKYCE